MSTPEPTPAGLAADLEQDQYLEELAREYAALASAKDPIEKRMEVIKAEYRTRLDYGSRELAGLKVNIARNPTFDEPTFRRLFPLLQHPEMYKTVPDREAVKDLSKSVRSALFKDGAPKVSVTVPAK